MGSLLAAMMTASACCDTNVPLALCVCLDRTHKAHLPREGEGKDVGCGVWLVAFGG